VSSTNTSVFNGLKLRVEGSLALRKAIADNTGTHLTRFVFGDEYLPEGAQLSELTSLVSEKLSVPATFTIDGPNTVMLNASFNSNIVTEDFAIREYGVYASDGTEEFLYAVDNIVTSQAYPGIDNFGIMVALPGVAFLKRTFSWRLIVADSSNVTVDFILPPNETAGETAALEVTSIATESVSGSALTQKEINEEVTGLISILLTAKDELENTLALLASIPAPPSTGTATLQSIDGTLEWVEDTALDNHMVNQEAHPNIILDGNESI